MRYGLASMAFEKIYPDAQKANMLIVPTQSHAYGKFASPPNSNTKCYARLKMLMCAAICHLSLCLAGLQLDWAWPTVSRLSTPLTFSLLAEERGLWPRHDDTAPEEIIDPDTPPRQHYAHTAL